MTEIQDRLLGWVRARGRITLEGNREYWTILEFAGGRFVLFGGDSMTGEEEHRKELTPEETLEQIRRYARDRGGRFGGAVPEGDAEIYRFLVEHPNL